MVRPAGREGLRRPGGADGHLPVAAAATGAARARSRRRRPGWAALARTHTERLLDLLRTKLGVELPPLPDPADSERARLAASERERAERIAFTAWNEERTTTVPNIWADRAPESAIAELVQALANGGRIRLPGLIAAMRARYGIAATDSDAAVLARHGYSPAEIATALA